MSATQDRALPRTASEDVRGAVRFNELGFWALPGNPAGSAGILDEPALGERLGLGSVWLSERLGNKDIGVISGAAAAGTKDIGIASGLIANLSLRHPLTVAGYASTMMDLSGGRFALGMGRGVNALADATGKPHLNFEFMGNYIDVLRALWRGERVVHDSPIGKLGGLAIGVALDPLPPIILGAIGQRSLAWAGRHCDGVVLGIPLTKEAVERSTRIVRKAAEEAGRDPDAIRVWACVIAACEVPEEVMLSYIVRRMNTYVLIPGLLELMCAANGWDADVLARLRTELQAIDAAALARAGGSGVLGDELTSRDVDDLRRMHDLYPEFWIQDGSAVGTADECAQRVLDRFDAGADGVVLHGSQPKHLAPLLKVWPKYRAGRRFHELNANPGL